MDLFKCSAGVLLVLLATTTSSVWSAKFPSNVDRCTAGDAQCIMRASEKVLRSSKAGNAGLALPPIDPLRVEKINIQDGNSGGPVNINLLFKNVTLSGLSQLEVYEMNGFDRNIETPKSMKAKLPGGVTLTLEGDYTMGGRVLLLPINGKGRCKLDFHGWDSDWKIKTKAVEKNGKQYMTIQDSKLGLKASRLTMDFENLFNGDKQLSETMNTFLNENWQEILNELRPSLSETISQILISIVSGTFSRIPYDEIFTSEQ